MSVHDMFLRNTRKYLLEEDFHYKQMYYELLERVRTGEFNERSRSRSSSDSGSGSDCRVLGMCTYYSSDSDSDSDSDSEIDLGLELDHASLNWKLVVAELFKNPVAIDLIREIVLMLKNWGLYEEYRDYLSLNSAATDLILEEADKFSLELLSINSDDKVVEYVIGQMNNLKRSSDMYAKVFENLCMNCSVKALDWVVKSGAKDIIKFKCVPQICARHSVAILDVLDDLHKKKALDKPKVCKLLSKNPFAVPFLKKNIRCVNWKALCRNESKEAMELVMDQVMKLEMYLSYDYNRRHELIDKAVEEGTYLNLSVDDKYNGIRILCRNPKALDVVKKIRESEYLRTFIDDGEEEADGEISLTKRQKTLKTISYFKRTDICKDYDWRINLTKFCKNASDEAVEFLLEYVNAISEDLTLNMFKALASNSNPRLFYEQVPSMSLK